MKNGASRAPVPYCARSVTAGDAAWLANAPSEYVPLEQMAQTVEPAKCGDHTHTYTHTHTNSLALYLSYRPTSVDGSLCALF